ncbi:MAG TPA: sterol desaturase family protein [Acidobacteriota bacterium]|jgi:sterol desaturase/sphingolipid hydroxylase (fatty acid hydroxylase superfamily)
MPASKIIRFFSFWFYPLAAAALLYAGKALGLRGLFVSAVWLFAAGLLIWTLIEYFMHRFLFHWHPRSRAMHKLVHELHLAHHAAPRDPDRILARPEVSLPVSALVFGILFAVTRSFFPAAVIMAGIWTGFLYYEAIHYRLHRSAATAAFLGYQRRRHFRHHFVAEDRCFGVTTPLWDIIFGTF